MIPTPQDERFWLSFHRTCADGSVESWEEDFAMLADAREAAEQVVDAHEADHASISARYADIFEEYTRDGWTIWADDDEEAR